jgi:hypothetical protein
MRRLWIVVGALIVASGLFLSGRESTHGFSALWEHWYCPMPLVAIVVGVAVALLPALRSSRRTV